ncbi:MAG TPA: UDP-3-O-(3-hydroxymyristoyl)glucosamine N-acyltransferase [Burkholderiaceae bacterium]|nr:UDP-3-O-(3-hydroxymyristoyl)glucosamine N-acyltransferase [Burkholderiaceae bacterium]
MTPGGLSLSELTAAIAERTSGRLLARVDGDPQRRVSAVAALDAAGEGELSFLANPRYRRDAAGTRAGAVVVATAEANALRAANAASLVVVDPPYAWFALAAQLLHPVLRRTPGVHPTASVDPSAMVDPSATIDAGAFVGSGARVGARTVIGAGAVLGAAAVLGADVLLHPRAVVLERCEVGHRSIVHSGAVIGADGFGFAPLDGGWIKIPQVGRVLIGEDVEIGANTSIDRGTMGDTVIESGAKIDNQVQVGHNCFIGANTVIAGCVGLAGSARVGRNCMIGGAAGIAGHLSIADGCVIGPATVVSGSITQPGHYTGFFPIMNNRDFERTAAIVRRLDNLRRRLRALEAAAGGNAE